MISQTYRNQKDYFHDKDSLEIYTSEIEHDAEICVSLFNKHESDSLFSSMTQFSHPQLSSS